MPINAKYEIVCFYSDSTADKIGSTHRHSVIYFPDQQGIALSWGLEDNEFGSTGPGARRGQTVQLKDGLYYHSGKNLGFFGHRIATGILTARSMATILAEGKKWESDAKASGKFQYPYNCRGAVDHLINKFGVGDKVTPTLLHAKAAEGKIAGKKEEEKID